jgi:hypothetical protein
MSTEPNYLVQTEDGVLHGYWRHDILLCDLAINCGEKARVFRAARGLGAVRYMPTTVDEIRDAVERKARV